jgi:hypothetical protein
MRRRIVLGAAALATWAGGCTTTDPARTTSTPTIRRPSGRAPRVGMGARTSAPMPTAPPAAVNLRPRFSRAAVPDAVMLRDQAEAGYREGPSP